MTPQSAGLDAGDFPHGKLPADMSTDELLTAMREVMDNARSNSFNPDIAHCVWDELDNRMSGREDAPNEWAPYYG